MTLRLSQTLAALGLATSGSLGARLAARLGMETSWMTIVRRIMRLREAPGPTVTALDVGSLPPLSVLDRVSVREALWLMVRPRASLQEKDRIDLETFCHLSSKLSALYTLVQDFGQKVRQREAHRFLAWKQQVAEGGFLELQRFATGLERDKEAILAGLSQSYSNGMAEGFVNKPKLIKRQSYERTSCLKRYILTGTPGSGKTSILHELKRQGYSVVEEAATDVIARGQGLGNSEPWLQADFIDSIVRLQKQRQLEASTLPDELQWYDRSPICTLALSRYLGYAASASLVEEIESIEREGIYQRRVFFIEHLGFCQPTEARKITFEEALIFEKIHEETYASLGYDLLKIPPGVLSQRVQRIMEWTWIDF